MDDQKALSIIGALANGVNPLTGEVFAPDAPYQSPEIVRALFLATRALERIAGSANEQPSAAAPARTRARAGVPGNVGKPWSADDDQRLLAEFEHGKPIAELATLFGRTIAGIEARLEKHGRLTPSQRSTSDRYVAGQSAGEARRVREPGMAPPAS